MSSLPPSSYLTSKIPVRSSFKDYKTSPRSAVSWSEMLEQLTDVVQPAADPRSVAHAMRELDKIMTSFVDEAVSHISKGTPANDRIRAEREIGFAVARLFNPAKEGDTATNRNAAFTALVDHAGMSRCEANHTVTEWIASFERLQADLAALKYTTATKIREIADNAADALPTFTSWAIVGFLVGAIAGHIGAKRGDN